MMHIINLLLSICLKPAIDRILNSRGKRWSGVLITDIHSSLLLRVGYGGDTYERLSSTADRVSGVSSTSKPLTCWASFKMGK